MKIYIIFGDVARCDGENVQVVFLSKEKAEQWVKRQEDFEVTINSSCAWQDYCIEEFETED